MDRPPFPGRIGRTIADSTPWWPARSTGRRPNVLVVLFDDVGFSDFGCYGSPIRTPVIDAIAARGLRYSGFHTTAMCSTTRSALMTGCNHHSVGVGCLANFDSGYPGYRGKIAPEAATLAERLRPLGYANYMVGKWHVTSLNETGPSGPFDGWPLGRGYDRYYGFMDAETDQYAPELVRDNTHVDPPARPDQGYHLTEDLVDESIRFLADHHADRPDRPWHLWFAPGACHAPHQAPKDMIRAYDPVFADGWDAERVRRLARQTAMGLVPESTTLPPPNPGVARWDTLPEAARPYLVRLQAAYAAMLEHADTHLGRLIEFLESTGQLDDTIIVVMSDNGASQEGGPNGFINAMGPYNQSPEDVATKIRRIDDIGGPDSHTNFPWGWAQASNTPLRRYKQNTHGGGIRDPLVISWPARIAARGEIRHGFRHATDLVPTLLEAIGAPVIDTLNGRRLLPLEGESFAHSFDRADSPARSRPQYFEMFGHRGLWSDGWKAVAWHPVGKPFDADQWELYHLDEDFNEVHDLAAEQPQRLTALQALWWQEAERCQVLPLDDRFGPRFAENGRRVQGARTRFVMHRGMGHLPTDVAPDVRSRDYEIAAEVVITSDRPQGVLIAHGDATSGYSLYLRDGVLVHDLNVGGTHHVLRADRPVTPGRHVLGFRLALGPWVEVEHPATGKVRLPAHRTGTLLIDGEPAGSLQTRAGFNSLISWSGLDIGLDRQSPVSDYEAPFAFTDRLIRVTVTLGPLPDMDGDAVGKAEMARQ